MILHVIYNDNKTETFNYVSKAYADDTLLRIWFIGQWKSMKIDASLIKGHYLRKKTKDG